MIWPGGTGASGSFDWKPFSFEADFAAIGIDTVAIRIGLQNTQGKILFRDLKVEEVSDGSAPSRANSSANVSSFSGRYGSVEFSCA